MENYKPNSLKSKLEEKLKEFEKSETPQIDPITDANDVKFRKKNGFQKLADKIFLGDWGMVKAYLISEYALPGIKKIILSILWNGADLMLNGNDRKSDRKHRSSFTPYRDYYDDDRDDYRRRDRDRNRDEYSDWNRSVLDYEDPILSSREKADDVLTTMEDIISRDGYVSVATLYELVGRRTTPTDRNFGWKNLRDARIVHIRDGWWIKMPRVIGLN